MIASFENNERNESDYQENSKLRSLIFKFLEPKKATQSQF